MRIERYSARYQQIWDDFIKGSKNGTFLFLRDYMEYHQDRFEDHSLMLFEDDKLLALLPANQRDSRLDSHGGLTYGGFVTDAAMKTPKMLVAFEILIRYAQEAGFNQIRYKAIPHIYHQAPAEEDLYALHLLGARLISRNVITAVNLQRVLLFQTRRKRGAKKARKAGVEVRFSDDLVSYWVILEELLISIHDAVPVHSLDEIKFLQGKFPDQIKLCAAYQDQEMLAGVLIYETTTVVRSQYIAATAKGRNLGALDLVFESLLNEIYTGKSYFEFGTSEAANTPNYLNKGLIEQKEGFGARAVMHDIYLLDLAQANISTLREALQ